MAAFTVRAPLPSRIIVVPCWPFSYRSSSLEYLCLIIPLFAPCFTRTTLRLDKTPSSPSRHLVLDSIPPINPLNDHNLHSTTRRHRHRHRCEEAQSLRGFKSLRAVGRGWGGGGEGSPSHHFLPPPPPTIPAQLVLPGRYGIMAALRGAPAWLQEGVRSAGREALRGV